MKLFAEVNETVSIVEEVLDEATGKKNLFIEGVFMQANVKNRNGRVYPTEVLDREVARYNEEYVQKKRAFGELGHPQGPTINLERVSHLITDLRKENDNYIGKAKIMDSPYGNIVKGLIGEGAQLGVSSRGMGTLKPNRDGVNEVQKDFYLATAADIVADPSAPDAFVNGIMEGVEWIWDNGVLKASEVERIKEGIERDIRSRSDREQAFTRAFSSFMNKISKS
jgi:hypothetical protein